MSVYLYNLMFSLTGSNVNVGSFEPYPSPLPPSRISRTCPARGLRRAPHLLGCNRTSRS
jgi:hypothetical protein